MSMATTVMDYLFQRTLDDLIKGLRVQSVGESRYVSRALDEIRKEIKSTDASTKSIAVQKLAYLNMIYFVDMSWAEFHIVEVMSLPKFAHKKIGYMAAGQCFNDATEVMLLVTNLLRKDLSSKNEYETGLALGFLSKCATTDLARDLTQEVFTMLGSSRLHIRKKATLTLLRIFTKFPDGIKLALKRLVEKLDEPDSHVVAAAISVLHELARRDPRPYLPLAPELYRLLVESTNSWVCIKVVKMFALLLPLEPRLAKKISDPLCNQLRRTNAKSLVFECIRTVSVGLLDHDAAVELCGAKLRDILGSQGDDPTLKFLGLQALMAFLDSHPSIVAENKSVIIKSLSDGDPGIQRASLRLIDGMVSDSNVTETVQVLVKFARISDKAFSSELISAVLSTCSRDSYELLGDFSWYVNVLCDLARLPHFEHGAEVERQLVDIGSGLGRLSPDSVEAVRRDVLKLARDLLIDSSLWENGRVHRVLAAAAWLVGEYVQQAGDPFGLVEALLQPRLSLLPPSVQAVYLQAVIKIFVFCKSGEDHHEVPETSDHHQAVSKRLMILIKENASSLLSHVDSEVQERASNLFGLINMVDAADDGGNVHGEGLNMEDVFSAMREVFNVTLEQPASQSVVAFPHELEDDLDEMNQIIGESRIFTEGDKGWQVSGSMFQFQQKNETEEPPVVENATPSSSTHRQRYETYYLPKDVKPEVEDDLVTPATRLDAAPGGPPQAEADLKAAEESLVWTTKPRRAKARPVVIGQMGEDDSAAATAVRTAFGSLRSMKNGEDNNNDKKSGKVGKKHRHSRRRAKSPLKVSPQLAVVPDFLL